MFLAGNNIRQTLGNLEMCSVTVKTRLSVQQRLDCRDKLAQAEKRVETMTAAMRSANPLTPFDFPMTPSSTHLSFAPQCPTYSESLDDAEGAGMQPIPAAHLPHFQNVEMVISRGALGGWVEQASPACGAASVAGAWNAIKPEGKEAFILSSKFKTLNTSHCEGLQRNTLQMEALLLLSNCHPVYFRRCKSQQGGCASGVCK